MQFQLTALYTSPMVLKATVDPIGLRERITLELKGDVLICHGHSWAQSYTVYIPSECMAVEAGRRRDGRILIRLVMLPLVLLFGGLLYLLGGMALEAYGVVLIWETFYWIYTIGLVTTVLLSVIYTAYCIIRFLPKLNTVRLRINSEDSGGTIEFWHEPGKDGDLDRLVGRLFDLEKRAEDKVPFPLRMSYTWQHIKPTRAALVSGFVGTVSLFMLAVIVRYIWEWWSENEIVVTPWFFTIFILPWLWSLGQYLLALFGLRHEPDVFRTGIRHYDQGDFNRAEQHFRRTLELMPRHVPSLYLLIQLCAYRYEFDDAFKFCAQLAPIAPEEAENLQQELWTLKRLVARMEA